MNSASPKQPFLGGSVALVTGATSGIGLEIGRWLASHGATVLAGCRSAARFAAARADVAATSGAEAADRFHPAGADLTKAAEIESLVDALALSSPPIDLLLLNAGIHDVAHRLTADGHELTYASNYLGHFRLLHRLASSGRLASEARILVTQSSSVHANPFSRFDLGALERPHSTALGRAFWRATASPNTKILLALAAIHWPRQTAGTSLAKTTFLGASPGAIRTANVDQPGLVMGLLRVAAPLLLRPAAEAAELLAWCATAPEVAGRSGEVFGRDRKPVRLKRAARDPGNAAAAWVTTERVLGLPPLELT